MMELEMPEVVEEQVAEAAEQAVAVEAMASNHLHRNLLHPLSISSSMGFQAAKAE